MAASHGQVDVLGSDVLHPSKVGPGSVVGPWMEKCMKHGSPEIRSRTSRKLPYRWMERWMVEREGKRVLMRFDSW